MTSLSNSQLNVRKQLALNVYLSMYGKMIDYLKPSMGLVEIDYALAVEVLNTVCSGDLVIDITNALPEGLARPTVRSYISGAGYVESAPLYTEMVAIIRDPNTPPYFKGFRAKLCQRIVSTLRKKSWGIGDMTVIPKLVVNEYGYVDVQRQLNTTIRLRDIPDGKRKEN